MSHIHDITTDGVQFQLPILKSMIERRGWEFKENQKTYLWYGRIVGDHSLPEGITEEELGKCDHAIKIPDTPYEIGLLGNEESGYRAMADFWLRGGLGAQFGEQGEGFRELYDMEKDILYAESQGWAWEEVDTENVSHKKLLIYADEGIGGGGW